MREGSPVGSASPSQPGWKAEFSGSTTTSCVPWLWWRRYFRTGAAGHHGDEREPQELGEEGLGYRGTAAEDFNDGGVLPGPAIDQAEEENGAGQPVHQAAGPVG